MPLMVPCACGKKYTVDDAFAGRRVKCKACNATLTVPQPVPASTASEADDFQLAPLEKHAVPGQAQGSVTSDGQALLTTPSPKVSTAAIATPAVTSEGMPVFVAVSQGWAKSLIYRVYEDRDALLLLDVAPYNVLVDLELARHCDGSHWAAKTVQSLKTWIVGVAGTAGAALGILGIAFARAAFTKPNEAIQLVSFIITVASFVIPLLLILATWSIRVLVRRSQELDAMTPDDIRRECARGGDKYRLVASELSEVVLKPTQNPGQATRHLAEVTFKHPSGNWRLQLFKPQDVQSAITAFRRLTAGNCQIDPSLGRA